MGSLFRRWLRFSVMRKGLTGSSPMWTFIGVLGILNALRQRVSTGKSAPLISGPIRAGEVIEIRHRGAPERKLRKERAKRSSLLQSYLSAPAGRKGKKVRRRFSGTMVEEFAAAIPAVNSALAKLLDASPDPKKLTRHQIRQQEKLSRSSLKKASRTKDQRE